MQRSWSPTRSGSLSGRLGCDRALTQTVKCMMLWIYLARSYVRCAAGKRSRGAWMARQPRDPSDVDTIELLWRESVHYNTVISWVENNLTVPWLDLNSIGVEIIAGPSGSEAPR